MASVAVVTYEGRVVAQSGAAGAVRLTRAPGSRIEPMFDGSGSQPSAGGTAISAFNWTVGGAVTSGERVRVGYAADGEYAVELTVVDDAESISDPAVLTVTVVTDARTRPGRGRLMGGAR